MEEDILNYLYQLSCFVGHPVTDETLTDYSFLREGIAILNQRII